MLKVSRAVDEKRRKSDLVLSIVVDKDVEQQLVEQHCPLPGYSAIPQLRKQLASDSARCFQAQAVGCEERQESRVVSGRALAPSIGIFPHLLRYDLEKGSKLGRGRLLFMAPWIRQIERVGSHYATRVHARTIPDRQPVGVQESPYIRVPGLWPI